MTNSSGIRNIQKIESPTLRPMQKILYPNSNTTSLIRPLPHQRAARDCCWISLAVNLTRPASLDLGHLVLAEVGL